MTNGMACGMLVPMDPLTFGKGDSMLVLPSALAVWLKLNHKRSPGPSGCLYTDYARIPNFKILASTTNGTSGIGKWHGRKVYFYKNGFEFVVERI